jgi:ABC-2 type transport system permease protein
VSAERWLVAAEVVGTSMRAQWADMRTSPLAYLLGVVQPLVFLLVTLTPQTDPPAAEGTRAAFGVLLTAFWGSTVWSAAGILRRERMQGTLARTLTSVRDPRLVVLGKSFGSSLVAIALVTATVAGTLALLRQPVQLDGGGWLLLGLALVVLSGTGVGLLLGSLFVLSRHGPQLSSALMYPVYLLGGMLVPPDLVPGWLGWLSWGISLRWLQQYLVAAAGGRLDLPALLAAGALTAGYAVAGAWLFRRVTDLARRQATVELY